MTNVRLIRSIMASYIESAKGSSADTLSRFKVLHQVCTPQNAGALSRVYHELCGKAPLASPRLVVATSSRILPWGLGIYAGINPPKETPKHCIPIPCVEIELINQAAPETRLEMINWIIRRWEDAHAGDVPSDVEMLFREAGWTIEDGRSWSNEAGESFWHCAMTLKPANGMTKR